MAKELRTLPKKRSRKRTLEIEKEKLIKKIRECKNLSELDKWAKTMAYYPVLSKDFDWDYGFLLYLIEFKLNRMANYFHTHDIIVNEERNAVLCEKAIRILNAGYLSDAVILEDLNGIYVNDRNAKRFLSLGTIELYENNIDLKEKYYLVHVREEKAKALFWKFLHHYIEFLWD